MDRFQRSRDHLVVQFFQAGSKQYRRLVPLPTRQQLQRNTPDNFVVLVKQLGVNNDHDLDPTQHSGTIVDLSVTNFALCQPSLQCRPVDRAAVGWEAGA